MPPERTRTRTTKYATPSPVRQSRDKVRKHTPPPDCQGRRTSAALPIPKGLSRAAPEHKILEGDAQRILARALRISSR